MAKKKRKQSKNNCTQKNIKSHSKVVEEKNEKYGGESMIRDSKGLLFLLLFLLNFYQQIIIFFKSAMCSLMKKFKFVLRIDI